MTQDPDWVKRRMKWAGVRCREVELATAAQHPVYLAKHLRLGASRKMLDDIKQAHSVERSRSEWQL
jgi:hypothetical protein